MRTDGSTSHTPRHLRDEPESLAELRGDGARTPDRWRRGAPADADAARTAAPDEPQGVHVSPRSADLLDGMSDYGD